MAQILSMVSEYPAVQSEPVPNPEPMPVVLSETETETETGIPILDQITDHPVFKLFLIFTVIDTIMRWIDG